MCRRLPLPRERAGVTQLKRYQDPEDLLRPFSQGFPGNYVGTTQAPISQGPTRRSGRGQNPFLYSSANIEFSAKF